MLGRNKEIHGQLQSWKPNPRPRLFIKIWTSQIRVQAWIIISVIVPRWREDRLFWERSSEKNKWERKERTGEWRKFHNQKLRNLHSSPKIIIIYHYYNNKFNESEMKWELCSCCWKDFSSIFKPIPWRAETRWPKGVSYRFQHSLCYPGTQVWKYHQINVYHMMHFWGWKTSQLLCGYCATLADNGSVNTCMCADITQKQRKCVFCVVCTTKQ